MYKTPLLTSNATAKDKEQLYQPYIQDVRQAFLLGRLAVANENRTWARKKEHAANESMALLDAKQDVVAAQEIDVRKNASESLQRFYKRSRFAFIAEYPQSLDVMEQFLPGSTQGVTAQTAVTKPELEVDLSDALMLDLQARKAFEEAYYLGRIAAAYESRAWSKQMLYDVSKTTFPSADAKQATHNAREAIFISLKRFYKRNRHLAIDQCPEAISSMSIMLPGSEKGLDTAKPKSEIGMHV